ncbi:Cell wall surface anchor family protein [Lachnospiraceae bacterium TWA4]|nr:Cell wall surface anchor family protein [Lachnospiraceae bacterium TWA4]
MKKTLKQLAIATLISMMTISTAMPAFADGEGDTPGVVTPAPAPTYSITLPNETGHTYEIYQIFTGDYAKDEDGKENLSNVKWGQNGTGTAGEDVDSATIEAIKGLKNSPHATIVESIVGTYATLTNPYKSEQAAGTTVTGIPGGYYLIKDKDKSLEGKDTSATLYIIQVIGNETLEAKADKPTFDKEVQDEVGDAEKHKVFNEDGTPKMVIDENGNSVQQEVENADGWGETADHEINESFRFRLTAKIPNNPDMDAYKRYNLKFTDTMSEEVTFEEIESVKAGGVDVTDYVLSTNAQKGASGITWTLEIPNLKDTVEDIKGLEVVVVYKAHLNESAKRGNRDDNRNTGYLEYSNNPNIGGEGEKGKTPDDTVFVFTYEFDNKKTNEDRTEGLSGAEFKLLREDGTEVGLIYDSSVGGYRPVKEEETATGITTPNGGEFKIVGVDAGTYKLQETKAPEGYNLRTTPITIVISATHSENADGKGATTTFSHTADDEAFTTNTIVNNKGPELPETGGMGTTMIYSVGGLLVLGAGTVLASRKRKLLK